MSAATSLLSRVITCAAGLLAIAFASAAPLLPSHADPINSALIAMDQRQKEQARNAAEQLLQDLLDGNAAFATVALPATPELSGCDLNDRIFRPTVYLLQKPIEDIIAESGAAISVQEIVRCLLFTASSAASKETKATFASRVYPVLKKHQIYAYRTDWKSWQFVAPLPKIDGHLFTAYRDRDHLFVATVAYVAASAGTNQFFPNWRKFPAHEIAPADRGPAYGFSLEPVVPSYRSEIIKALDYHPALRDPDSVEYPEMLQAYVTLLQPKTSIEERRIKETLHLRNVNKALAARRNLANLATPETIDLELERADASYLMAKHGETKEQFSKKMLSNPSLLQKAAREQISPEAYLAKLLAPL